MAETNFELFDEIELHPMRSYINFMGDTEYEPYHGGEPDVEIYIWNVCGHYKTGGLETLAECYDERIAALIYEFMRRQLTVEAMESTHDEDDDYCHVEMNEAGQYVPVNYLDWEKLQAATGLTSFDPSELTRITEMLGMRDLGISYPEVKPNG